MTVEVRRFSVTIPAGTAVASPLTTAMTMPARVVRWIEVVIPPGPRGFMGFRIGASGNQIVPVNSGAWVIADDQTLHWDMFGTITSGAWQLTGYNTGTYDHTVYVDFGVDPPQLATVATGPAPIPSAVLTGTAELPN